jgi:hypothetical protein
MSISSLGIKAINIGGIHHLTDMGAPSSSVLMIMRHAGIDTPYPAESGPLIHNETLLPRDWVEGH